MTGVVEYGLIKLPAFSVNDDIEEPVTASFIVTWFAYIVQDEMVIPEVDYIKLIRTIIIKLLMSINLKMLKDRMSQEMEQ